MIDPQSSGRQAKLVQASWTIQLSYSKKALNQHDFRDIISSSFKVV
jgi:hypothetical protein